MYGAGGHLSGLFTRLSPGHQCRAVLSLLELRNDVAIPDPRALVPAMAEVAIRQPRLNLLNVEAVAATHVLSATVWLSTKAAVGVLPSALTADGIAWTTVTVPE